jgi:hypothetical protein
LHSLRSTQHQGWKYPERPGFISWISPNKSGSWPMKIPNNWMRSDRQSEDNAGRGVESTWVPLGRCSA